MNKGVELFLYTRKECSLCDVFSNELDSRGIDYKIIDVDSDPELKHRYGARLPVLVSGFVEICEGSFDPAKVESFFSSKA